MNAVAFACRTAVVVLTIAACPMTSAADAPAYPWIRADGSVDHQQLPRRPQPGDKLGYPKEQSASLLPPDVRGFLDAILRLYSEDGLFLDSVRMYELLGTQPGIIRKLERGGRIVGYSGVFEKSGVFARPEWHGYRIYVRPGEDGRRGYIDAVVQVDPAVACIDSRAVEGYLDLYLHPSLEQVPPIPPERWDRHGVFGRVNAMPLSNSRPSLGLAFSGGCLARVDLGMSVLTEERIRP